jgi:hypothetical protein
VVPHTLPKVASGWTKGTGGGARQPVGVAVVGRGGTDVVPDVGGGTLSVVSGGTLVSVGASVVVDSSAVVGATVVVGAGCVVVGGGVGAVVPPVVVAGVVTSLSPPAGVAATGSGLT